MVMPAFHGRVGCHHATAARRLAQHRLPNVERKYAELVSHEESERHRLARDVEQRVTPRYMPVAPGYAAGASEHATAVAAHLSHATAITVPLIPLGGVSSSAAAVSSSTSSAPGSFTTTTTTEDRDGAMKLPSTWSARGPGSVVVYSSQQAVTFERGQSIVLGGDRRKIETPRIFVGRRLTALQRTIAGNPLMQIAATRVACDAPTSPPGSARTSPRRGEELSEAPPPGVAARRLTSPTRRAAAEGGGSSTSFLRGSSGDFTAAERGGGVGGAGQLHEQLGTTVGIGAAALSPRPSTKELRRRPTQPATTAAQTVAAS